MQVGQAEASNAGGAMEQAARREIDLPSAIARRAGYEEIAQILSVGGN
jgi:hypothetical protein